MLRLSLSILALLTLLLLAAIAGAQEVPPDPGAIAGALSTAVHSKAWPIVVWSVLLLGIYLLRWTSVGDKVWNWIPLQFRPMVVVALGILWAVGEAKIANRDWSQALINSVMAALAASGANNIQSKLRKPTPVDPPAAPDVIPPPPRSPTITDLERDTKPSDPPDA